MICISRSIRGRLISTSFCQGTGSPIQIRIRAALRANGLRRFIFHSCWMANVCSFKLWIYFFLTCHHGITDFDINAFLNQDSYRLLKFVSDLVSIFALVDFVSPANCHQPETRAVGHPCNPCNPSGWVGHGLRYAASLLMLPQELNLAWPSPCPLHVLAQPKLHECFSSHGFAFCVVCIMLYIVM